MARKVDPSQFGSSAPKLTQEDLEEDAAILTIEKYEEVKVDDDNAEDGKRQSATLTFRETGDKVLWLNKGQVETLVEQLGDDADAWTGQKIPVEKHTATFGSKKYPKVRVMPTEEWDKAFKEAGVRRSRPAAAGAKR
jgi:hypothetical protein